MQAEAEARREIVRIGRLLYERQLIVAAEGNLSVRLGGDRFLVTPAGVCKGFLDANQVLVVDLDGNTLSQLPGSRPTSEWQLHRQIYSTRSDVTAVCHAHPPYATAFAAARQSLSGCLLPEAVVSLGAVPLARYATPGTDEVPASVSAPIAAGHNALLLANHGAVALGEGLEQAFFRLETVERLAQVTLLSRLLGGERRLDAGSVLALGGPDLATLPCEPGGERPPASQIRGAAGAAGIEHLADSIATQLLLAMGRVAGDAFGRGERPPAGRPRPL